MKVNFMKQLSLSGISACLLTAQLIGFSTLANAKVGGGGVIGGGGGDATEARVNEIRSDIVKWIQAGGSRGLVLPYGISLKDYNQNMLNILAPQKVVISFVENDNSKNPELKVAVNGIPKTCRGFFSVKNNTPNIICNISRFQKTKDSDQYVLIHHEYAGLAKVEKNEGAASDYNISSQLTEFLTVQKVLKLAIKSKNSAAQSEILRKSANYSLILTDAANNYKQIAEDLDQGRGLLRTANIGIKAAIGIEILLGGVQMVALGPSAGAAAGDLGGVKILGEVLAAGFSSIGGTAMAEIWIHMAQQLDTKEVQKTLDSKNINSSMIVLTENDLKFRNSNDASNSFSSMELMDYAKKIEDKLSLVSPTYKETQQKLATEMSKIIEAHDPSNKSYLKKVIAMGSDQMNFGELVQLSSIMQQELAVTFKAINDDLRAELVRTNEIIKSRN